MVGPHELWPNDGMNETGFCTRKRSGRGRFWGKHSSMRGVMLSWMEKLMWGKARGRRKKEET